MCPGGFLELLAGIAHLEATAPPVPTYSAEAGRRAGGSRGAGKGAPSAGETGRRTGRAGSARCERRWRKWAVLLPGAGCLPFSAACRG